MHWKGDPPPPPGRPAYAQPLSPRRQVQVSMAFVTDSNRPQLWQPPPTACLTASGAASEVPYLLRHPCPRPSDLHSPPPPPLPTRSPQGACCPGTRGSQQWDVPRPQQTRPGHETDQTRPYHISLDQCTADRPTPRRPQTRPNRPSQTTQEKGGVGACHKIPPPDHSRRAGGPIQKRIFPKGGVQFRSGPPPSAVWAWGPEGGGVQHILNTPIIGRR